MEEKHQTRADDVGPNKKGFKFYLTVVGVILLVIGLSLPALANMETPSKDAEASESVSNSNEVSQMLRDIEAWTYNNASQVVRAAGTDDISILEERLNVNVDSFLQEHYFDPYPKLDLDTTVYIKKGSVELEVEQGRVEKLVPSIKIDPENRGTGTNFSLTTEYPVDYEVGSAPVFLQLKAKFSAEISGKDETITVPHSFNRSLPFPLPFMQYSMDVFKKGGQGANSVVARLVNYMLNTVARYRVMRGIEYGMPANESPRNILNEGDVELAVNIAVMLWQMQVFRSYDDAQVNSIDNNFFRASQGTRTQYGSYNPSDRRVWGTAETQNYLERYIPARSPINFLGRTLDGLVYDYCMKGRIDPGDIIALYLVLDHQPIPESMFLDPTDDISVLYTEKLFNPRYSADTFDTSNSELFLNLTNKPFNYQTLGANRSEDFSGRFKVDMYPDYLVVYDDIELEGIYPPYGWYSNVVMCVLEYTWFPDYGTRCGEFPPDQRPNDHDFRMQWDMHVNTRFRLRVTEEPVQRQHTYIPQGCVIDETVELDFPVQVYVWLPEKPKNDALKLVNLNEGGMNITSNGTFWVITAEADAQEYIAKHIWQNLRPLNSLGFDEAVSIMNSVEMMDINDLESVSKIIETVTTTTAWKGDRAFDLINSYPPQGPTPFSNSPWFNLYRYIYTYIEGWGITTDMVTPIYVDGWNISSHLDSAENDLTFFFDRQGVFFEIKVENVYDNASRFVILRTHIIQDDFELDVYYYPLLNRTSDIRKCIVKGLDLTQTILETELTEAIEMSGVYLTSEVKSLNGKVMYGQASADIQVLIDSDIFPETGVEFSDPGSMIDLSYVSNMIVNGINTEDQLHVVTLGVGSINTDVSVRLYLDNIVVENSQAVEDTKALIKWFNAHAYDLGYLCSISEGSPDPYWEALMDLDPEISQRTTLIISTPVSNVDIPLNGEDSNVEFQIIKAGNGVGKTTYSQIIWGRGVEETSISTDLGMQTGLFFNSNTKFNFYCEATNY